jgi:hypothetical protein
MTVCVCIGRVFLAWALLERFGLSLTPKNTICLEAGVQLINRKFSPYSAMESSDETYTSRNNDYLNLDHIAV